MNSNFMEVVFDAKSENESFARACVAAFCLQLNPTLDEIADIKTAVSESVTNAVVHAYPSHRGQVRVRCEIKGQQVKIVVSDDGIGIANIAMARTPLYTTSKTGDRSGMGFTVMEGFMDKVEVESSERHGTKITLYKEIARSCVLVGE